MTKKPEPPTGVDRTVAGIARYDGPAGGWGALKAVALAVREQMGPSTDTRALLRMNQPDGFDCPGCAWPDPKKTSSFEFCENGAKAVTWKATAKHNDPNFFAQYSVGQLTCWSDHDLENAGRLTHPLRLSRRKLSRAFERSRSEQRHAILQINPRRDARRSMTSAPRFDDVRPSRATASPPTRFARKMR